MGSAQHGPIPAKNNDRIDLLGMYAWLELLVIDLAQVKHLRALVKKEGADLFSNAAGMRDLAVEGDRKAVQFLFFCHNLIIRNERGLKDAGCRYYGTRSVRSGLCCYVSGGYLHALLNGGWR